MRETGSSALTNLAIQGAALIVPNSKLTISACMIGTSGINLPAALGSTGWSGLWNSGALTNLNGRTFALVLLPAQPVGYFSHDESGEQRYAEICSAYGLRTVTTGHPDDHYHEIGYPTYTDCSEYNCMPLVDEAAGLGQHAIGYITDWIHATQLDGRTF